MIKKIFVISIILVNYFFAFEKIDYIKGHVIIKIEKNFSFNVIDKHFNNLEFSLEKKISKPLNLWLITYDIKKYNNIKEVIEILNNFSFIIYAQKDHKTVNRLIPNDPEFENIWHLHNIGQNGGSEDADIDAPEAWNISTGDNDQKIVIGVVDSGFDLYHQDIIDNIWININEVPNNGIDDDNNGYIDDINGWDIYQGDGTIPVDDHGTKVTGMIGAKGNNNINIVGVNWDISIMPIAGSNGPTSQTIAAYSYALDNKLLWYETDGLLGANIVAINSSFGINYADCNSGQYPVWNDMYNALGEAGILSVAATANININVDDFGDVPTSCNSDYIVSVTNTDKYDYKYIAAAYGQESIDLGAPGTSVCSIRPGNLISCTLIGTSYSAPVVSGAIGMIYSAASTILYQEYLDNPSEAAIKIKNIILNTVDNISSLDTITVSGGRLNLFNAVNTAVEYNGVCSLPGDFNNDININIQDIILIVNCILNNCEESSCMDLNDDFSIDIFDIIILISILLRV